MVKKSAQILICVSCLLLATTPPLFAQSPEFPYRTTVTGEDAIVRSGPGMTHYGTDRLPPGTEVEVHRHDPGGWIAIRPPQASFSLVQRDEVELLGNDMARVKQDDTVAWVGTRLNPVDKPMWQVKLRTGEMLYVLGQVDREQYNLGDNEPDWVQVTPPPGEFRWIAADELSDKRQALDSRGDRNYGQNLSDNDVEGLQVEIGFESDLNDQLTIADSTPAPNSTVAPDTTRQDEAKVPFEPWEDESAQRGLDTDWSLDIEPASQINAAQDSPASTTNSAASTTNSAGAPTAPAATGWRPAQQPIGNFVNQRSSYMAESAAANRTPSGWSTGTTTNVSSQVSAHTRSEIFDDVDSALPVSPPVAGSGSLQTPALLPPSFGNSIAPGSPLQTLEQRLTQEMLKPPAEWDLIQLAAQVQRARDTASTPDEIAAADRLLEKIRKCREIQAGYRATNDDGPVDLETRRIPGSNDVGIAQTRVANNDLHYNYDAFGYLNELVRSGGTGPATYVLQDEVGKITHQVSAPPGLNLRRYLNQRVGIIGNRGFNQQLNLDHVTAERVIAIDTLRR